MARCGLLPQCSSNHCILQGLPCQLGIVIFCLLMTVSPPLYTYKGENGEAEDEAKLVIYGEPPRHIGRDLVLSLMDHF